MYADLHLHTTYSDGTNTPAELCNLAKDSNIKVISITDHDSVDGIKALLSADVPKEISIIPGIELSIFNNGKMIHILGYYIDIYSEKIDKFIKQMSDEITKSTKVNFDYAKERNAFDYSWERVLELNPGLTRVSGSNVIKAMKLDNYIPPGTSLREMYYQCFWRAGNKNYISFLTLSEYDAVDVIKASGGIPVIAHPKEIGDDNIVANLIKYGAMGIEVFHPAHSKEDVIKYKQLAESNNLFITGGTDWHGNNNRFNTYFGMYGLDSDKYSILAEGRRTNND